MNNLVEQTIDPRHVIMRHDHVESNQPSCQSIYSNPPTELSNVKLHEIDQNQFVSRDDLLL